MHWLTGKFLESISSNQAMGLDIGCGTKQWNEYFKCDYIGIDIKFNSKADILASATNLPFSDNTFSFISIFSVIEYIEDDEKVLDEIYRVLKPSGKLLLISQNERATKANIKNDPSKSKLHKHIYNLKQINKKLNQHNFKLINYKYPKLSLWGLYYYLTSVYFFTISKAKK